MRIVKRSGPRARTIGLLLAGILLVAAALAWWWKSAGADADLVKRSWARQGIDRICAHLAIVPTRTDKYHPNITGTRRPRLR